MCDPVSASIALAAAGVGANTIGRGQAEKAQKKAAGDERARQGVIRDKSYGSAFDTLGGSGRPEQDRLVNTANQQRSIAYTQPLTSNRFMSPFAPSNPTIQSEFGRAGGLAQGKSVGEAMAKARLDAFGDANTATAIRANHNMQDIGFNTREASESANLLPGELEAAKKKGEGMRTLGDFLTMASSLTSMGVDSSLFSGASAAGAASDFGSKALAFPTYA